MKITLYENDEARREPEMIAIANTVFSKFDNAYITERLPHIAEPILHIAEENRQWLGFKLAYRRGDALYSWLGGTHPDARRQGIAGQLMQAQHKTAAAKGYRSIETRTRAANTAMIVLNLSSGFEITGYEQDRHGVPVVTQRKILKET